ncbi:DUF4132 domain-containing protein [Streptomyces sp. NPDC059787]|uniref:DUF7737 domain-containing protein n=1 Tax=Streptomyces sp. NPDC059787 TaxID=3346947 RepID=UPI00364D49CB
MALRRLTRALPRPPLVGTLARRLLWTVDGTPAGYADGALRTLTDTPVTGGAEAALWHPVGREPAGIVAWRGRLERHGVTQPFKQTHREGQEPVDPVSLEDVPPLALSEVLRDVDLFVGVSSVGNDPTWQDGGPGGRFGAYWASYGFGGLNQGAETRRALLERLVPRPATADRCTVEGRFLHVRGERHTCKIHLGSGNILMTPNDQYLCIVHKSDPAAPQTGYLPYEGDRMPAVILSKAMLPADDTAITDPTILSRL